MNSNVRSIANQVSPILRSAGVTKAALFGSYVRGDQRTNSDIDLLVELPTGKSLLDLASLKLDLEDHLHREVDILTYGSVHPLLKDRIRAEEVSIF